VGCDYEPARSALVCGRRRFDSVGWSDMMLSVLLVYELAVGLLLLSEKNCEVVFKIFHSVDSYFSKIANPSVSITGVDQLQSSNRMWYVFPRDTTVNQNQNLRELTAAKGRADLEADPQIPKRFGARDECNEAIALA